MNLTKRIKIQLTIFGVVALLAGAVMGFGYMQLPELLFGVGHYRVTVELPRSAGLYKNGNVSYRGTEVGRIEDVHLTDTGVDAVLSLNSGIDIPSDLDAQVHSVSAVGEQYVALLPRHGDARALRDGDVIPASRTSVPPDINALVDATNRGLQVIPHDNLKTTVDESYTAIGGLGPEISRFVKGSTELAIQGRENVDALTTLIDQSQPVLDSQTETSTDIRAWAAHLATITEQMKTADTSFGGLLEQGPTAVDESRQLIERLRPTLPVMLANLVTVGQVATTYHDHIEQILVLLPQGVANIMASGAPNLNTKQHYKGLYMDFNMNFNMPRACNTGFLPAQQQRPHSLVDYPDRTTGDVFCRIPQDSPFNVRGTRNAPCAGKPGKRAPTVAICESDEEYVPLNDGMSFKGDPNATTTGQDVPLAGRPSPGDRPFDVLPPESTVAVEYDPVTGSYVGPDGRIYTHDELAQTTPKELTWQSMLMPPTRN
jgi:phospholipid/cholesterol/gamma-HCH transport system substrate-binding protein